jgi:hypothetical protein
LNEGISSNSIVGSNTVVMLLWTIGKLEKDIFTTVRKLKNKIPAGKRQCW